MKTFLFLLIAFGLSFSSMAQTELSKETKAINKKINQAIQKWSSHFPLGDFPDIGLIIQQEINTSINRKLGRIYDISLEEYIKRYTPLFPPSKTDQLPYFKFSKQK